MFLPVSSAAAAAARARRVELTDSCFVNRICCFTASTSSSSSSSGESPSLRSVGGGAPYPPLYPPVGGGFRARLPKRVARLGSES